MYTEACVLKRVNPRQSACEAHPEVRHAPYSQTVDIQTAHEHTRTGS